MEIQWRRGNFVKLYSKMKIRIGGQNNTTDVYPGDEIEYDGSVAKHAGAEFPSPQLRSAVQRDWFSLTQEDSDTGVAASDTGSRNIARATSVNRDLSRVQRTSSMTTTSSDEDEVMQVSDRAPAKKGQSPRVLTASDNRRIRGMAVNSPDADVGTPVEIGRVRVPTNQVFKDSTNTSAANRLIDSLENMTPKAHLFDREVEREGIRVRTNVGAVRREVEIAEQDDGVNVGPVRHSKRASAEGITVKDTSNIREERAAADRASRQPAKPARAAKPVKKAAPPIKIDPNLPPRVKTALRVDPKFPVDWSFSGKLSDRLAAVKAHGPNQKFIQALYAAEGDQFRKVLEKEFGSLL